MIHAPSDILAGALVLLGLAQRGGSVGATWPIYTGSMPPDSNQAICAYDTTGISDGRLMNGGLHIVHPGVQLLFRSTNSTTGYDHAATIVRALDESVYQMDIDLSNAFYVLQNASRRGSLISLGLEEGKLRWLWSINVVLTYRAISE